MVFAQGAAVVPIPTSPTGQTFNQLGPFAAITVNGSQNVHVTATVSLGSTSAGGASALNLTICDFTFSQVLGNHLTGIAVPQNARVPMTVSMVIPTPPSGLHNYALCGASTNAGWNSQGGVYISAIAY